VEFVGVAAVLRPDESGQDDGCDRERAEGR
jgi:hypothetical protein